jgi:hypothetical protein
LALEIAIARQSGLVKREIKDFRPEMRGRQMPPEKVCSANESLMGCWVPGPKMKTLTRKRRREMERKLRNFHLSAAASRDLSY